MAEHSILVVEDEHTLRRLLEYRLSKQYDVRTAENGEEALKAIGDRIPDLIISDIMMPKMDGFALQTAVQSQQETRAIPFIFLTAKADDQSRLRGMRTGVDDYITKPFDIEQLLSRVERLLERSKVFQSQLDARIGHDFSQRLMPKKLPDIDGYRIFFYNSPKEHGGGDLFDWMKDDSDALFFTIGDVMGKGLQAKFYAFSFLGYLRSTIHASLQTTKSPAEIMARVNRVLMDDPPMEETFASLLLMRFEPSTNQLTYANAGHCRPLLISGKKAKIVEYSDLILGLDRDARFKDETVTLQPGTAIVSYTDGLSEQVLTSGQMAGEEGIMNAAAAAFREDDPVSSLLQDLLQRSESDQFGDDILVFWLEREKQQPRWFSPFSSQSAASR
jgi:serine phosphatase RsbU (regulator of sigma subunit)